MTTYSFPKYLKTMFNILKGMFVFYQIAVLLGLVPLAWALVVIEGLSVFSSIALVLGLGFLVWVFASSTALYFVEIGVDEQAIYFKPYWRWLRIPWENVIEFKPEWFTKTFRPKDPNYVLFAEKLPLICWTLGFLYTFSLRPGFMVSNAIENRQLLINKIQQKIKQNQKRVKYNKS